MAALPKLSNVPERQDLDVYRGASLVIPFAAVDDAGAARDITGFTIAAQIRRYRVTGSLVLAFTVVVENAATGLFRIELSAAQTATLKCGEQPFESASRYWWDVRIVDGAGLAAFMRQGEVSVWAQATVPA